MTQLTLVGRDGTATFSMVRLSSGIKNIMVFTGFIHKATGDGQPAFIPMNGVIL
jgi:hypothetical protein